MIWSYSSAIEWLDAHMNREVQPRVDRPDLSKMARLCELMGSPQIDFPTIHVTGTNGKGSTATMISNLLLATGIEVGLYTSPHLGSPTERIQFRGEPVSESAMAAALDVVMNAENALGESISWFEAMTAAAMWLFSDYPVQVAVIEVGLGGRFDATNVCVPDVGVVTNVSFDHAEYLGDSLELIAAEKAGIIKAPMHTLILGVDEPALATLFHERAIREQVVVRQRGSDFDVRSSAPAHGGMLLDLATRDGEYEQVFVPLFGPHQADNAAAAVAAVEAFVGTELSEEVVAQGLGSAKMEGRFELFIGDHTVVLDVAHNPAGIGALADTISEVFPDRSIIVVMGVLAGRNPRELLETFGDVEVSFVVGVTPDSPRALDGFEVASAASELSIGSVVADGVADALDRATLEVGEEEIVVVCGSFSVVGPMRELLIREGGYRQQA